MSIEESDINLKFTANEALVLFEWVSKFNEMEIEKAFEDQAEERVLWDLESMLEEKLGVILQSNYKEALRLARNEVRDEAD